LNIIETKNYFINNFDKIIKLHSDSINHIISSYIEKIKYDPDINKNNYKKVNTFPYYEIIYKLLPYVNDYNKLKIISNISKCMYGLKLLNKIPEIMNNLSNDNINEIIYSCSDSWTFPVFLYYLNIIKERNINTFTSFIVNNYSNSDDRIYKYIVNNNNTLKYLQYEENLINDIICNIFSIDCIGKYIHSHTHTHTQTHTHHRLVRCVCVYTHTRTHINSKVKTYIHTHTHKDTDTHTHRLVRGTRHDCCLSCHDHACSCLSCHMRRRIHACHVRRRIHAGEDI
jgi:hypothetical protein